MNNVNSELSTVETEVVRTLFEVLEPEKLKAFGQFLNQIAYECFDEHDWHFGDVDDDE